MNTRRIFSMSLGAVLALVLMLEVQAGDLPLVALAPNRSTKLSLTGPGMEPIHVTLSLTALGSSYPYKSALLWGGDVDELPKQIVAAVQVSEGGQVVFVPLSAYGDLGDVKSADLKPSEKGFTLELHGGNTASEYDAELKFAAGYLVSRKVILRAFPNQRTETATYMFPKRTEE
jgi:hypothetical protein